MQPPSPSTIVLAALVPLLIWRVYSRFKRSVGRQRLSRLRPKITLTIFPALALLISMSVRAHPELLASLVAALAAGGMLGVYGIRRTRFEPTPQGLYYTPNAHLGIALSALFVARLIYRLVQVYILDPTAVRSGPEFVRSPLTVALFGLLAGYYVSYAIGLIRWRQGVLRAKRLRESQGAGKPDTTGQGTS